MSVAARVIGDGLTAAAGAPVQMAAESCRAAVLDGAQHLELRPCQMVPVSSMKLLPAARMMSATSRVGRFISSFCRVAALHVVRAAHPHVIERICDGLQMPLRKMQIDDRVLQVRVSEQQLDGAQIGAGFEQVRREAVAKQMRGDALRDAGVPGRLLTCAPDSFDRDRHVGSPALLVAWKQIGLRLHPAPVLAQGLQQLRAQRHVAVASAFAFTDVDHHALAVDVADLQRAQLGRRMPVEYSVISIARCIRLLAASISRATLFPAEDRSASFTGVFGMGMCSSM